MVALFKLRLCQVCRCLLLSILALGKQTDRRLMATLSAWHFGPRRGFPTLNFSRLRGERADGREPVRAVSLSCFWLSSGMFVVPRHVRADGFSPGGIGGRPAVAVMPQ